MLEYVGKIFAILLEPVLVWIRSEGIGPGLAFVIVCAGGLIFVVILFFCIKDLLLIYQAKRVLERGKSESEFASNYNRISEDLGGS